MFDFEEGFRSKRRSLLSFKGTSKNGLHPTHEAQKGPYYKVHFAGLGTCLKEKPESFDINTP